MQGKRMICQKKMIKGFDSIPGKHLVKKEDGSSTVLVLLVMVTMLVLGLLLMMSSYSSLKLARKSGDWLKERYALEDLAEARLALIDGVLLTSKRDADAYIHNRSFESAEDTALSNELQDKIHRSWLQAAQSEDASRFIQQLKWKIYALFVIKGLEKAGIDQMEIRSTYDFTLDDGVFLPDWSPSQDHPLVISNTISGKTPIPVGTLLVEVAVSVNLHESTLSDPKSSIEPYDIIAWKLQPPAYQYSDSLKFGNFEVK